MLADIGGAMGLILGLNILDLILLVYKIVGIAKEIVINQVKNILQKTSQATIMEKSSATSQLDSSQLDSFHAASHKELYAWNAGQLTKSTDPILTLQVPCKTGKETWKGFC